MFEPKNTSPMPLFVADFMGDAPNNQRIMIDAQCFIIKTLTMTARQVGEMMNHIFDAAARNDWDYVESFPFVVRVYLGADCRPGIPLAIKRDVLAAGRCVYCGQTERLTVDHVRPYSKGGTHDRANLQCLCFTCNIRKSNKWESGQ